MTKELAGKVALVTGGGRGIGRAIAEGFAARGAAVAITARTESQLEETVAAINSVGGKVFSAAGSITVEDEVQRFVRHTEQALGPIDILVNNAGVCERGSVLWEADPEDWRSTIETNVYGQFLVSRLVLPGMIARGDGRVIFVSSGASLIPGGYTGFSAYGASKAAVNRLAETLATEASSYGVKTFAIHPGVIRTGILELVLDPQMESIAPGRGQRMWGTDDSYDRPVSLCAALASGVADRLSGAYLSVNDDIEDLVKRADQIQEHQLYKMRVNRLIN